MCNTSDGHVRARPYYLTTTTIVFLHYVLYDCMYVDLAVETIISPE